MFSAAVAPVAGNSRWRDDVSELARAGLQSTRAWRCSREPRPGRGGVLALTLLSLDALLQPEPDRRPEQPRRVRVPSSPESTVPKLHACEPSTAHAMHYP